MNRSVLSRITPAATAIRASQAFSSSSVLLRSIGFCLRNGGVRRDLNRVRPDDSDHGYTSTGGQRLGVSSDGLALDGAILQTQMDLAGAGASARDGQVDGRR